MSGGRQIGFNQATGFFDGGAELCKFVVSVTAMDGIGFVAGEFHPHFRRNALIRQRACEAVPQCMECGFDPHRPLHCQCPLIDCASRNSRRRTFTIFPNARERS